MMPATVPWTPDEIRVMAPLVACRLRGEKVDITCPREGAPVSVDQPISVTSGQQHEAYAKCTACFLNHYF